MSAKIYLEMCSTQSEKVGKSRRWFKNKVLTKTWHHLGINPSIILHPELLSYCMCNLAFVCELIVFTTVLHEARRDRVDSYHLFALPSFNGARAWTTSFVVKREWIEMLITPGLCGEDFWFIAFSGTILWRWLHSAIQQWFGKLLKILPSSFVAIVNEQSASHVGSIFTI